MLNRLTIAYRKCLIVMGRFLPRPAAALNAPERRQRRRLLQHRSGRRLAIASTIVPEKRPSGEDVAIAERLLAAHVAVAEDARAQRVEGRPDKWTIHYEDQDSIASLLQGDDPAALATYLCNVARHSAAAGFLQGRLHYEMIRRDPAFRRWVMLGTLDKLVSLAEALGASSVENPEEWAASPGLRRDPGELVERIERRLGLELVPPDSDGCLLKLVTPRGSFTEWDLPGGSTPPTSYGAP